MRSLAVALAALAFAAPASGAKPLLGILGNAERFDAMTAQRSEVRHVIVGVGQGDSWGTKFPVLLQQLGPVPMIGLGTSRGGVEQLTPKDIALGKGDGWYMALGNAIHEFGRKVYVRPMGEMNGHWNAYCAYTKDGRLKRDHETSWFKKAFARIYLIVHGGPATVIDAKLKKLGLPGIGQDLPANPMPNTRVVWNPQGYGSPDIPGNSAQAYYPGDAYVDVVGNDLYNIRGKAEWEANERLYKAHPNKPYSFPEWGLWGIDDPTFIKKMADFVRSHRRVEMLAYYDSKPGSVFDLASKPKSLAAYKRSISPLG